MGRWYDENQNLVELIKFVEELGFEQKQIIAKHLLQIVFYECDLDSDTHLNRILNNDYPYNRTYDSNKDISVVLDIIKSLSEEKQNFIVQRVFESAILSTLKED